MKSRRLRQSVRLRAAKVAARHHPRRGATVPDRDALCRAGRRSVRVPAPALLACIALAAAPAWAQLAAIETDGDGTARLTSVTTGNAGGAPDAALLIAPEPLQRWDGVGAAMTDSAAAVLAALPAGKRAALIARLFSPREGGFNLVRLAIGASDFSASRAFPAMPP